MNDYARLRNPEPGGPLVMSYDEVKALVITELQALIAELRGIKITDIKSIWQFILSVVISIQKVDDEIVELTGEQKYGLAVDIIIWVIYDELDLDIPIIPDALEKAIFKPTLEWLIPIAVEYVKGRM